MYLSEHSCVAKTCSRNRTLTSGTSFVTPPTSGKALATLLTPQITFVGFWFLHKWSYTICTVIAFFPAKLFTVLYLLQVIVVYSFALLYGIPLYKSCLFIQSLINGHLDYLQFEAIKNSDVMNIPLNTKGLLVHMSTHFCWAFTPEQNCHKPYICLTLAENSK